MMKGFQADERKYFLNANTNLFKQKATPYRIAFKFGTTTVINSSSP